MKTTGGRWKLRRGAGWGTWCSRAISPTAVEIVRSFVHSLARHACVRPGASLISDSRRTFTSLGYAITTRRERRFSRPSSTSAISPVPLVGVHVRRDPLCFFARISVGSFAQGTKKRTGEKWCLGGALPSLPPRRPPAPSLRLSRYPAEM